MERLSQHVNGTRWIGRGGLALLFALILSLGCESTEAAGSLNVVIIKTDDQRWDTLWAMPIVQEELVRHGVTFTNAFVSTPLCCPERASFLAGGFYAHNTGVLDNKLPNGGVMNFLDRDTLPVRLQRAGYRTALIGKYINGYPSIHPISHRDGQNSSTRLEDTIGWPTRPSLGVAAPMRPPAAGLCGCRNM